MLFEFNRFSSLLLVFFIHGLVYALLLFRKSVVKETRPDKWLALFLLVCILYISPWMLGFAGWYDNQPYRDILFYVPFQQLFFIGPLIWFYVQSLLNPGFRFRKKDWLHLLPGILYLVFSAAMFITDKLVLKKYYFLAAGTDPDFDTWYQVAGFISMFGYFLLSLRYYNVYRKLLVQVLSYADTLMFRWVRNFLIAFLLMLIVRLIFYFTYFFINGSYQDTWWYFLFFALIFYYIAISGYSNSSLTRMAFRPGLPGRRKVYLLSGSPRRLGHPVAEEEAEVIEIETVEREAGGEDEGLQAWKEKLLLLMQAEKLYENPELSLADLAKELGSNPSIISRAVNRGFGMNFNDFVNQFRVDAVTEALKKGEHKRQTLLGIAFGCGFNSKATFNRAFKKVTGYSPKDWLNKGI